MTDRFKIALEVFNRLIPSLEHSLEQRLRDFHNNEPIDDMLACVREALTRPSREEKLLNEIVSAYNDLHEFFDVDNGTEPDGDSIGWQGDMELPTTFGQLRRLKQAIAEAGE